MIDPSQTAEPVPTSERSPAVPPGRYLAFALLLTLPSLARSADDPAPPLKVPGFDTFLVIPLRVHVLASTDLADVNCGLTDADIHRVIGKVNGIWHQAGVHWRLESLIREPAAKQAEFKAALEADDGDKLMPYRLLAPEGSRATEGIDVYYIHKFSVNGVYLGRRMAFVQETARLRPVPGGSDEPLPRVTAHELGHTLGLPHRQDRTNLLASGNNGTTLNEDEAARARRRAAMTPGSLTVTELKQNVDEAMVKKETAEARKLLGWLAEIPGEGGEEARKKLETLPADAEKKADEVKPEAR
jgi:hypothetical protein